MSYVYTFLSNITIQNSIQWEIKSRINVENVVYQSVQDFVS